jgi:non-heme chloroperoxidase
MSILSDGSRCKLLFGWREKMEISVEYLSGPKRNTANSLRSTKERGVHESTKLISALLFVLLSLTSAAAKDKNPDARNGFVTSWDGAKIHYIEAGPKVSSGNAEVLNPSPPAAGANEGRASLPASRQSPTILFVPGFTMPGWSWEKQIARFSADYRVVAMDLRSQGDSPETSEGDYPASHARDIKAVIDTLQLAPVALVGWSMGVPLIASYVDQFGAGALAGIVFVDGVPALDTTPEDIKSSIEFLKGLQTNRSQLTDGFVRSMYRKPQSEEYLQRVIKASVATPTDSAIAIGLSTFTTDNRPALAKIDKPTLIACANKGLLPQFQEMQKSIPGARLEFFDDAGHALFVDDADRFNTVLNEFLKSLK